MWSKSRDGVSHANFFPITFFGESTILFALFPGPLWMILYFFGFFGLRNKKIDKVLDEKESNEQEASSSSEDIAESASNGETDNTALDTGKSNMQFPDCMRFLLHGLGITY